MTRDKALTWFEDLLSRGQGLLRPGGALGTHYNSQELAAWTNEVASAIDSVLPPNHAIAVSWEPTVKKIGSSGINFRGAIQACVGVVEAARNLIRDRRLPSLVDATKAVSVDEPSTHTAAQDGTRIDFVEAKAELNQLRVYAEQFRQWNRNEWPHLKNNEDFGDVYELPGPERAVYEKLYEEGRDLAVDLSDRLQAFNRVGDYPTFSKYVDDLSEYLSNWPPKLREAVEKARAFSDAASDRLWSVNEMLALAEQELSITDVLHSWIDAARKTKLYMTGRFSSSPRNAQSVPTPAAATSSQARQAGTMTKPHVFIGSSTEGLAIAKVIQLELEHSAECVIWSQGVFGLSEGTLESLVKAAETFQYAILVLTPDDLTVTRGENKNSARDNVIFELGLFMGSLGRDRTFIVHSRSSPIDLPSDLAGITTLAFNNPQKGTLQSALGPACTRIAQELDKDRNPRVRPSRMQAEEPSEFPIELWMNSKPMSQGDAICIVDPGSGGRMGKIHITIENTSTQTLEQGSFSIAAITPKTLRTMDLGFTVSPLPDGTLQHVVHDFPRIFQGQFREFEMVPDWSKGRGQHIDIKIRVYTRIGSRDFPLKLAVAD